MPQPSASVQPRLPRVLNALAVRMFGRGVTQGVVGTIMIQFGAGAVSFGLSRCDVIVRRVLAQLDIPT